MVLICARWLLNNVAAGNSDIVRKITTVKQGKNYAI
jgi:hypothetical protein